MADKRPNILLFTTDQQRGDHLSIARAYGGNPVVETPNADAFVNQGVYFPNAYTELPSTVGARRCLHSGQGNYACGLIGYAGGVEWHETVTLAQVLADAGYHCINVGWRNMHPRRKLYGFHNVIAHDLRREEDDYWEWLEREAGPDAREYGHGVDANGWMARPWHMDERFHPTVWTTNVTLDQIRKRDPTRPFFMWSSHLRPHSPYDPPQCYWDMYINRQLPEISVGDWAACNDIPNPGLNITTWRGRLTPEQNHRMRVGYLGSCSHLDAELGRLLYNLNRSELLANTLVIYTADHGDMQSDHHLHRKCYAYEGSARIPMLIRYPAWAAGPADASLPTGVCEKVVGLQDVMPTILEFAGIPTPPTVTGRSMLAAARGEAWREFFHGEHSPCYCMEEANQYLTDAKEKYIWFPTTGRELFFDLVHDRQELRNLAADPAWKERVALWRNRLIELLGRRGDGFSDGKQLLIRKERYGPVAQPPKA